MVRKVAREITKTLRKFGIKLNSPIPVLLRRILYSRSKIGAIVEKENGEVIGTRSILNYYDEAHIDGNKSLLLNPPTTATGFINWIFFIACPEAMIVSSLKEILVSPAKVSKTIDRLMEYANEKFSNNAKKIITENVEGHIEAIKETMRYYDIENKPYYYGKITYVLNEVKTFYINVPRAAWPILPVMQVRKGKKDKKFMVSMLRTPREEEIVLNNALVTMLNPGDDMLRVITLSKRSAGIFKVSDDYYDMNLMRIEGTIIDLLTLAKQIRTKRRSFIYLATIAGDLTDMFFEKN